MLGMRPPGLSQSGHDLHHAKAPLTWLLAIYCWPSRGTTSRPWSVIIGLAACHNLPAVYIERDYVKDGGPISYGLVDQYRRAASYIDRILKGEKPAELVQVPTKYELVINLKTVALGKARERRIRDESVTLLKEVQPVKFRPGQSLAGRPVASVASRRATGGCEAYTARKQAARVQLRHLI
jgi:hypothetical protein